jgi:hypothetical protein
LKSDQIPNSDKTVRGADAGANTQDSKAVNDEAAQAASTPEVAPTSNEGAAEHADKSAAMTESSSEATLRLPEAETPDTPLLTLSPPKTPTPVSGDILLPMIIFSVVKANPHQLVSHLLYTQRYRNKSFGGEESYCLINLMAVVEFLENVDLAALGLKDSESKILRYVPMIVRIDCFSLNCFFLSFI